MASTDIENKNTENILASADEQGLPRKSTPLDDASFQHEHSHTCNDPTHHHNYPPFFEQDDAPSSSSTGASKSEMLMKRKAKKNQKKSTIRAETMPGNRGTDNIDDLINFINGSSTTTTTNNSNNKKSKNKSPPTN